MGFGEKQVLLNISDHIFKNSGEPISNSAFVELHGNKKQWLTSEATYREIPVWCGYTQFNAVLISTLLTQWPNYWAYN